MPSHLGDDEIGSDIGPLALGPMLRYVDETSATIWAETRHSGTLRALGHETQTFSVGGRHYGVLMLEGLEPGSTTEYQLFFDDELVWPRPDDTMPPCVIRTPALDQAVSLLVGSCRAAAPHEPPFTLELSLDHEARGVDALWAHARRMLREPLESWPNLLLLVGDQIYADDSSPGVKERLAACRPDDATLPIEIVAGFEEYCWLYHEAWSSPVERWLLSTLGSAMIFDDHDMIDDWNISGSWVRDIRTEPWWSEHAVGGLMSYWIYQHLGNLSPEQIRSEGMLAKLLELEDGTDLLRSWATQSEASTPLPGGYNFSYRRQVGDVTVIVIDCRNGRVLEGDTRLMVDPDEWAWVCEQASATTGHLVLATSVPVFISDGLHDLQVWNERLCSGAWGKLAARASERLRRGLDLEDWSAFSASYADFVDLLEELRMGETPPRSITVASGDIHFSYAARVPLAGAASSPEVWQIVSSPIRNALIPPERGVIRMTLTKAGRRVGAALRRLSGAPESRPGIQLDAGPFFANNMCEIHYDGNRIDFSIEQATASDEGDNELQEVAKIRLQAATSGGGRLAADTVGGR